MVTWEKSLELVILTDPKKKTRTTVYLSSHRRENPWINIISISKIRKGNSAVPCLLVFETK